MNWLPRFSFARWGGCDEDGLHDYAGWSIAIEWAGLIFEVNGGRARQ